MKLKCCYCNETVTRSKETVLKQIWKLGIDLEDYKLVYHCRRCRKKRFRYSYLDWFSISSIEDLPLWFIEKYKDKVNWYYISSRQELPEEFIERHQDRVYWYLISKYQKLSESFIEKFRDKVNWYSIAACQGLSPEFVIRHIDRIPETILSNPRYKDYPNSLKLLLETKFKMKGGTKI